MAAVIQIFQSEQLGVPTRCDLQGQGLAPLLHFFRCADSVPLSHLSFNFRDSDSYLVKLRLSTRSTDHPKIVAGRATAHRHRPAFQLLTKHQPCLLVPFSSAPKSRESTTHSLHTPSSNFSSPLAHPPSQKPHVPHHLPK